MNECSKGRSKQLHGKAEGEAGMLAIRFIHAGRVFEKEFLKVSGHRLKPLMKLSGQLGKVYHNLLAPFPKMSFKNG